MRVLAVDPGEKRIGLAISDESGTIANPLTVVNHVSREEDAGKIIQIAAENRAKRIIVGQSFDEEGLPNLAGRRAENLADALRALTGIRVELWDESLTTQDAVFARREMGVGRKKRSGHLDALAATVLLQSYLDERHYKGHEENNG